MTTRNDYLPIIEQVAESLGEGWTAALPENHDNGVYLHGPDNVRLHVHRDWQNKARLIISGSPTRDEWDQHRSYSDDKITRISVSVDKTPARIAGDITRRLLPGYTALLAELRERLAAHNDYDARAEAFKAEILAILRTEGREARGEHEISWYGGDRGYGHIQVSPDSVYIERMSLPREAALALFQALTAD